MQASVDDSTVPDRSRYFQLSLVAQGVACAETTDMAYVKGAAKKAALFAYAFLFDEKDV